MAEPTATISGSLHNWRAGEATADFSVTLWDDQAGLGLNAEVANGSYTIRSARPGIYRLSATGVYPDGFRSEIHKVVTVQNTERLVIDFVVPSPGVISGSVLEENGSPARGVTLRAVDKSYARGVLRYFTLARSTSDGYGLYRFDRLPAWRSLLIVVDGATANGSSPADTFFPSSTTPAGAQEIVLHPGEKRDGVDIRRINGPTYCISGIADADPLNDTMHLGINRAGPLRDDYLSRDLPIGNPPGKFTLCGLHSGRYQIEAVAATMKSRPPAFRNSQGTIVITDSDAQGIKLGWRFSLLLSGETIWDGVPNSEDAAVKVFLHMWGKHRQGGFAPAEPAMFLVTMMRKRVPSNNSLKALIDVGQCTPPLEQRWTSGGTAKERLRVAERKRWPRTETGSI